MPRGAGDSTGGTGRAQGAPSPQGSPGGTRVHLPLSLWVPLQNSHPRTSPTPTPNAARAAPPHPAAGAGAHSRHSTASGHSAGASHRSRPRGSSAGGRRQRPALGLVARASPRPVGTSSRLQGGKGAEGLALHREPAAQSGPKGQRTCRAEQWGTRPSWAPGTRPEPRACADPASCLDRDPQGLWPQ